MSEIISAIEAGILPGAVIPKPLIDEEHTGGNAMHFTGLTNRWLVVGVLGAALTLSAGSRLAESGKEWRVAGGDIANTRYSSLDQINTANVDQLSVAWIQSLAVTSPRHLHDDAAIRQAVARAGAVQTSASAICSTPT